MTTAAALVQVGGNVLISHHPSQVAQPFPALVVVRIKDEEAGLAFLVEQICAERGLTPQAGKQVADV